MYIYIYIYLFIYIIILAFQHKGLSHLKKELHQVVEGQQNVGLLAGQPPDAAASLRIFY